MIQIVDENTVEYSITLTDLSARLTYIFKV